VWIAVATCVLVAIIKKRLKLDLSLHSMLQILSVTPFENGPSITVAESGISYENFIRVW